MEQQVQVLQVCSSCCCLSRHPVSHLKACKLVSIWVHEQHCACQQFINTLLYCIQQVLKPHQNLDSKVANAVAVCVHQWLLQRLLQCRLQDRCCGHSSWCERLAQGESVVCGAKATQVPRLQHRGVAQGAGSCQSSWRPAGNQPTSQSINWSINQSVNQLVY